MSKPIAELRDCAVDKCANLTSWLCCVAKRTDAPRTLRSPKFQLYDGGVFFAGIDVASYRVWLHALKGNKTAAQAVLNHRHILEFFPGAEQEPTQSQLVCLGRKLEKLWTAKLKSDFPRENIVVSFREGESPSDELFAHLITVFIPREEDERKPQRLFLGACHPRAHL